MALTLEHVSVVRGGRALLSDVSARFEPGRVTVILGPNGAGKSTLLQVAAGLLPATGQVLLDGDDVARMPADVRARAIGYLPQEASAHWDMMVEEVVALGRLPYRDRDAAAIESAMERTGTTGLADRRIGTLSGGERARVHLARLLAGQPQWLVMDEPVANLDPYHALDVLSCLRRLAADGAGIVLVLHDLPQSALVADTITAMSAGRVLKSGEANDVLTAERVRSLYNVEVETMSWGSRRLAVPVALRSQPTSKINGL